MKQINVGSKIALTIVVVVTITTAIIVFCRSRPTPPTETAPVSIGLRGANRVSKPMSARQQQRFENYFLATPAQPSHPAATPNAVSQAQAINAFNWHQNQ